ncbi:hypothetical protein E1176_10040 [Fulvivirga sp. RKSG066]|uniref:T9SS type B sorting domain-containing protein n=1 Tax=Fulvivirga aurantia TaxID=2529383 RepID=UPI0012BB7E17|nr:gliding motility-associated C-terminal domain-containing protein [Fulvivirga aurantia]MTI21359.1 hypothetical protein [Fulvivirga aurantia]
MDPQIITLPNTLGIGGGAVASDYLNGELMFYTDGVNVYAADDEQIATLLGSTTRNQSASVALNPEDVTAPGDTSEYYIFTIDNAGLIRYSIYDKNIYRNAVFPAPPDGDMDPARLNVIDPGLPTNPLSEGMIVISNAPQDGFWLITHELGTTNYNVTQIDETGLSTTSTSIAGAPTDVANFSYSRATNQIAVSPTNAETIVLLDINLTSGALSLDGADFSTITASNSIFDIEWSSNGNYVYISGDFGGTNDEIRRVNLTETPLADSLVLTSDIDNSFGLQYGADTAIYNLYQSLSDGSFQLGRIEAPNVDDVNQVLYNPQPIDDTDYQAQQFPSFLTPFDLISVDFTFSGTCATVPTYFFPQVTPDFSSITWDFLGDGNYVPLTGGSFTYPAAGDYNVTMRVNQGGAIDSVTRVVSIEDFELTISIDPQRQYWCPDDFGDREDPATSIVTYTASVQGANSSGAVIRWSNQSAAEANATTTFVEPGTYYVVATDPTTGCEAYLEQQVFEYGAQNTFAFVWYFGDHGGLDFNPLFDVQNPGPITPIDFGGTEFNGGNQMVSPEGCAVYCDGNGDPLLFSDGQEVYNRAGTQLTTNLGGSENATQSIFIVENPGDATQYFLFFTEENSNGQFGFKYAVFDLKMLDGDGDLVREGGDPIVTTLYDNSTERITGNANWVITHEYNNDIFRAYPITGQGIGAPVFSNVGEVHNFSPTQTQGYMKLSGDKLAVALSISDTENYIDLFDFDVTTGAVTPVITLDFTESGQAYGLEFSQDNRKLFSSLRNSGGGTRIVRWEIDTTTIAGQVTDEQYIRDSETEIALEAGVDIGALQRGPQGSIYFAKDGDTNLGSINNPNDLLDPQYNLTTGDFPNVGNDLVNGGSNNSRLGLPNFVDFNGSSTPAPSLSISSGCQNQSLTFTVLNPLPDAEIESYVVQVYDDNNNTIATSPTLDANNTTWNFTSTQTPGNYEAQLFILNTCGLATASDPRQPFVINPLPTVGTITTTSPSVCGANDGSAQIPFSSTGSVTYSISGPVSVPQRTVTSPTTETVTNLGAGFYTLTVTQDYPAGSCSNTYTFNLSDPVSYVLNANEDDNADCNGENGVASFSFSAAPAPASFNWEFRQQSNNTLVDSGDESRTATNPVNSGDYYFEVVDNNGCTTTADVTITEPNQIDLTIGTINPSCDGEVIAIDVNTSTQNLITVNEFVNGGVGDEIPNYEVIGANDSISISIPAAGEGTYEYVVVAPGTLEGPCSNAQLISVSFGSSDPSPFDRMYAICTFEADEDLNSVKLLSNQPGFTSVEWFDDDGNRITAGTPGYTFRNDSIIISDFGTVTAELTNVFGCVTTTEIDVIQDCKARINAPNAFRPGSSLQQNQTWNIFPFLVSSDEFEIYIYNRWGELVFQSSDLDFMVSGEGWNGGYDNDPGRPVQGGTYAYKAQFKNTFDENAEVQESRGGITLIR